MASHDPVRLRLLAAEVREELARVDRCVAEMPGAADALRATPERTLIVYGAAALLESFYTGVEKALRRVAVQFGGVPQGEAWHRELLTSATLDVPAVRPPVLSAQAAAALERYLAFRHRFRNLYVFDLDLEPILQLLTETGRTWQRVRADLEAFAATLERWAAELGA